MSFVKKTKALCVTCNKIIPAEIIYISGRLYLKKFCPTDGVHAVKIFNEAQVYTQLYEFSKKLNIKKNKQKNFSVVCSGTCNMECPICYFDWYKSSLDDIAIEKIKELTDTTDNLILYGAESFCHKQTDKLLDLFKNKKIPPIITNGLLFADYNYTKVLKSKGLKDVFFQFDGFNGEANKVLRGEDYTEAKCKALSHLSKEKINISFYSVIKKYTNESEIENIFKLAVGNKYIKEIAFLSYIEFATDKTSVLNYEKNNLLFDELIELVLDKLQIGNLSDFVQFQKIFLFALGLRQERGCLCNAYYFIFLANGKKYLPQHFFKLNEIVKAFAVFLDRKSERFVTRINLGKKLFFAFTLLKNFRYNMLPILFKSLLRKKSKFLKLKIVKCCSPYDFDTDKMKTCGTGVIFSVGDKVYKKDKFSISPYYKLKKESN